MDILILLKLKAKIRYMDDILIFYTCIDKNSTPSSIRRSFSLYCNVIIIQLRITIRKVTCYIDMGHDIATY